MAARAEITFWLKNTKREHWLYLMGFYVPKVSMNCLTCPKGVKYKSISNKQAVFSFLTGKNILNSFWCAPIHLSVKLKLCNILKNISL